MDLSVAPACTALHTRKTRPVRRSAGQVVPGTTRGLPGWAYPASRMTAKISLHCHQNWPCALSVRLRWHRTRPAPTTSRLPGQSGAGGP